MQKVTWQSGELVSWNLCGKYGYNSQERKYDLNMTQEDVLDNFQMKLLFG